MSPIGDAEPVLRELNPWWSEPGTVRPTPPRYRRRGIREIVRRMARKGKVIEALRGPRQVGKTTAIQQIVQDLLAEGVSPREILFVRFDLDVLRDIPGGLRTILHWFADEVRGKGLRTSPAAFVFLDEIHKLASWASEVKHAFDTFQVRILLTGSSSVLVARGGRESLAGRTLSTELSTFSFRETLEAWHPDAVSMLPAPMPLSGVLDPGCRDVFERIHRLRPRQKLALRRHLERYFSRGGYPRLHSGDIDDDHWADYLTEAVFESVLGADIPDLFPVQEPRLLRHIYLDVARLTGAEISQPTLTERANAAGFRTTQPTVGRYLHYLADALLIREFRRYPLHRQRSARVPPKITLSDLGVRNALFRAAPSLWEGDPQVVGPLVETLAQSVLRAPQHQVFFWRDHEEAGNRRSPVREVDFVLERPDGATVPVEVKFRRRIDGEDHLGLRTFLERFGSPHAFLVTRESFEWNEASRVLSVPLMEFLLAF